MRAWHGSWTPKHNRWRHGVRQQHPSSWASATAAHRICARAILAYADANIPPSETHKLYLDQGTTGWDAGYLAYEQAARQIVKAHGYSEAEGTLMTYDAVGAGHNEWYWQQRVERPLGFLLDKDALSARAEPVLCPSEAGNVFVSLLGVRYCTDDAARLIPGIYIHNHRKVVVR